MARKRKSTSNRASIASKPLNDNDATENNELQMIPDNEVNTDYNQGFVDTEHEMMSHEPQQAPNSVTASPARTSSPSKAAQEFVSQMTSPPRSLTPVNSPPRPRSEYDTDTSVLSFYSSTTAPEYFLVSFQKISERGPLPDAEPWVLPRPLWQPDHVAITCRLCKATFSALRRRHHCRHCGYVYCNNCSYALMPLPHLAYDEPVRVCDTCRPLAVLMSYACNSSVTTRRHAAKALVEKVPSSENDFRIWQETGVLDALLAMSQSQDSVLVCLVMVAIAQLSSHEETLARLVQKGLLSVLHFHIMTWTCEKGTDMQSSVESHAEEHVQILLTLLLSASEIYFRYAESSASAYSLFQDGGIDAVLRLCALNLSTTDETHLRRLGQLHHHSARALYRLIQSCMKNIFYFYFVDVAVSFHNSTNEASVPIPEPSHRLFRDLPRFLYDLSSRPDMARQVALSLFALVTRPPVPHVIKLLTRSKALAAMRYVLDQGSPVPPEDMTLDAGRHYSARRETLITVLKLWGTLALRGDIQNALWEASTDIHLTWIQLLQGKDVDICCLVVRCLAHSTLHNMFSNQWAGSVRRRQILWQLVDACLACVSSLNESVQEEGPDGSVILHSLRLLENVYALCQDQKLKSKSNEAWWSPNASSFLERLLKDAVHSERAKQLMSKL